MIDSALLGRLVDEAELDDVAQLVVDAVVEDDGRVLLLKRPVDDFMGGIFELPSGKVEPGEDLRTALTREVEEETGPKVTVASAYLGSFDYASGSGKKSRQFNFVVVVDAAEPVVLQEHAEYRWVPIEDELPVTDAVKTVFETYRLHSQG